MRRRKDSLTEMVGLGSVTRLYRIAAICVSILYVSTSAATVPSQLSKDEYAVIAAVVQTDFISKPPVWIMLPDRTVTFSCESKQDTGFAVGDCSGMRLRDQTPVEILAVVQQSIPGIPKEILTAFLSAANESASISAEVPLNVKQYIWDQKGGQFPSGITNPDFAIYPSRAAFNEDKNKVLIYLGCVSWVDKSRSFGEYAYLEKVNGKWFVMGRSRVWSL